MVDSGNVSFGPKTMSNHENTFGQSTTLNMGSDGPFGSFSSGDI